MEGYLEKIHVFRLHPGEDLKNKLITFAKDNCLSSGCIITGVGSLEEINIRTAEAKEGIKWFKKMEIVSIVGTISRHGCHLHISLSDNLGNTIGGHLLEGCKIYTTAEIVIGCISNLEFRKCSRPTIVDYKTYTNCLGLNY